MISVTKNSSEFYPRLCSQSEDLIDKRDLSYHIIRFRIFDLTFADHVHCFKVFLVQLNDLKLMTEFTKRLMP